MKQSITILEELKEISSVLAAIGNQNVYRVPPQYFENFSSSLINRLTEESDLPAAHLPTLTVPKGYFENLPALVLEKIKTEATTVTAKEEIALLSPTLAGIGNKQVYKVPQNYFEHSVATLAKAPQHKAKVVAVNFRKRILQYAAAVIICLGLALFAVKLYQKPAGETNNMAQVTNTKVLMNQAETIIKNQSFDEVLQQVSENEIESYLTQRGLDVEAALVASTIEADNLPSAEDYLFNEDALSEFLKEQKIPNL